MKANNTVCFVLEPSLYKSYTDRMDGDWLQCAHCNAHRRVDEDVLSEVLETNIWCRYMFWSEDCPKLGCQANLPAGALVVRERRLKQIFARNEMFRGEFGSEVRVPRSHKDFSREYFARECTSRHKNDRLNCAAFLIRRTAISFGGLLHPHLKSLKSMQGHPLVRGEVLSPQRTICHSAENELLFISFTLTES